MENIIAISQGIIQPIITSNIFYTNSVEEFEKIALAINETKLAFDNNKPCFYIRSRDKYGEYSPVKIFFYEDFSQKVQNIQREDFIQKCKKVGLDETDIKIAEKCFIENMSNENLWDWLLRNKIKDVELDTVRTIRWRLRKKIYPELIKHPKKKSVDTTVYK